MIKPVAVIIAVLVIASLSSSGCLSHPREKGDKIQSLPASAEILFLSNRDTGSRRKEVYAMDSEGKHVTRITFTKGHSFLVGIDSSRRYVVVSRADEDTFPPKGLGDEDKKALWIIDLKTKEELRLTDPKNNAEGDSFSPDGEWIVFHMTVMGENQSDIYKIKRDGSNLTRLTYTENASEADPAC